MEEIFSSQGCRLCHLTEVALYTRDWDVIMLKLKKIALRYEVNLTTPVYKNLSNKNISGRAKS